MSAYTTRSAMAVATLCSWSLGTAQTPGPAPTKVAGPFEASWSSLKRYKCPDWFRDAKFGIWAHWTAQCVPEMGDWYARSMYEEGSEDYNFHVAHYGHPSKVGFKDIDRLWTAANWDPEKLMDLYVRAGAKYFVALANHHDNFDAWNSKYQPWNSVNIGPHKDIVGAWAAVARRHGLRFGVTVHAARSWDWFDVSHGADKKGPNAGAPYDGTLTQADGRGQWWEGYDPVELYSPAGAARTPAAFANYETKFFNRTMDLVGSYHPDLLYFDDGEPPTSNGLLIASNYYNLNRQWHNGDLQAVLTVKDANDQVKKSMVLDYERGRSNAISPEPWQTDTCIGEWHYRRSLYDQRAYKTPEQVIRMLADIVSKNGNLLLNIPVRGDGTIDGDEVKFLHGMADWMDVNKEAIFGTRPWKISGEGPVRIRGGGFSEGGEDKLTAEDFRFTTRGKTLYAIAMGWPSNEKFLIRSLASSAPGLRGAVAKVSLLGSKDRLKWRQTESGLEVIVPSRKPCDHAWTLKIDGLDLALSNPAAPIPQPIREGADGQYSLRADDATLTGGNIQVETRSMGPNIGFWDNPADFATWTILVDHPGTFKVEVECANVQASSIRVEAAGQALFADAAATKDWDAYRTVDFGTFKIDAPGKVVVTLRAKDAALWHAINVAQVRLIRR